jgi:tetratricopeptide (TPR) repeat protein
VRAFIRISRLVVLVSLVLCVVPGRAASAATPAEQDFEQGVQAFRAGNYQGALQSFLDARQAGLDTPGLRYDLGATYYRLGRYAEAEPEFQALARDLGWAPLAHYNLGLTAQRMGRERQATEHFEQAHRTTTDPNLRALAATALERLGRAAPRTSALVSVAGGYDSNVALSQDAVTVGSSHQSDSFVETLAAASRGLTENTARGWVAHGGLVVRKYTDLDQFDLTGLRAGLSYETDSGPLQTSVGGYFDTVYIGGNRLERVAMADAQARIRLDAGRELRARYQLGRIAGGGGFEYLDGWQQRLSADAGFALGSAFVRAGYQLELNDRRDLQQQADFFSASPTRHSLFATVALSDVGGWQSEARGEYRVSRYRDPDRQSGLEVRRKDDRYGFALRASRSLSALWRAFVDTSYYRNQSNLNPYDYGRYQLVLGIEAVLGK